MHNTKKDVYQHTVLNPFTHINMPSNPYVYLYEIVFRALYGRMYCLVYGLCERLSPLA